MMGKIKEYLQNYLDTVVVPNLNKDRKDEDKISFNVFQMEHGNYQPSIHHVFIDVEPPHTLKEDLRKVEKDIKDFLKIFSINLPIKIHWNKRPIFKNDTLHTEY